MSKWFLCRGVSLHKDQLTFKQNSSYELFFFHYIFSFFFPVLVVRPHRVHPVTTVLTHYSPIARYSTYGTAPPYLSDSLRPTSEIVALRCLRSADTTTLQVPSTRRATLGDRAFPVAAACAWNSLPLETRACSSLLTFRRETKSHLFRQSYGLRLLQWSADVCIELCNSFRSRFCKVPPQLWWQHCNPWHL